MSTTCTTLTYPFDPTGSAVSNLIQGEQQQLVAQNFRNQHFIVPKAAPFFADTLSITYQDTSGTISTLQEGVHYYVTHWFISASRACAMRVYGSITFIDTALAGIVSLNYQTIGGEWTISSQQIATIMADVIDNPRITSWEEVSGTPYAFPPEAHSWDVNDLVGMDDVVTAINAVTTALQNTGSSGLAAHEANHNNPHVVTAAQVGLGNVQNYSMAADSDAVAGTSTTLYMSPATTAAAIQSMAAGPLQAHITNYENPHETTAAQVGLGNVANYAPAQSDDASAGTSTSLYMTPATTMVAINSSVGITLQSHILNYDNPHETSADQVGLGNVANFSVAQNSDAIAGTANNLYMTPATTAAAIANQGSNAVLQAHITNYENPHETTAAQVGAYSTAQVNSLLAGYVTSTGVAANSALFCGFTLAEVTAQVLSGTANNASMLGGMTPAELQTYITGGTAADAAMFGGMTPEQWDQYIASATVANATQLNGMNVCQLTSQILSGTAASAAQLSGYSLGQLVSLITNTAMDSIWSSGYATPQDTIPAASDTTDPNLWIPIAQVPMQGTQGISVYPDFQAIVTGGDSVGDVASGTWFVRASVRNSASSDMIGLQVINLTGVASTESFFGYTVNTSNATAPMMTIWIQTPQAPNTISINALSEYSSNFLVEPAPVNAPPPDISYVTSDTFATVAQVASMIAAAS
jgi:hypothetical protein